jgi:mycothiol synthase
VPRIEILSHLGPLAADAVSNLLASAATIDGHAPVDEHAWVDLVQGGRGGYAGLVAWADGHDHPVGYAQVTRGQGDDASWGLEWVVDPHHRTPDSAVALDLVRRAGELIAGDGGGHLHMWVNQPRPEHDRIAAEIGLKPGRILYQMRRPLPYDLDPDLEPLPTRPFRPGQDEQAWLEVNNRAFSWHPEQGGWEVKTLEQREAEPWFDLNGFLLHENESGELDGFCWTKIHADHDPPLGEIYVIAADPDKRTPGLGRRLVIAGLKHLSDEGLRTGMLYVDAGNTRAVKLYIDMGFVINHLDQAYVGDIRPAPAGSEAAPTGPPPAGTQSR